MWKCKYCNLEFENLSASEKANHSRWCNLNPKRKYYADSLVKVRECITDRKNQYSYGALCSEETRKKLSIAGSGRRHTEETKQIIREKALASKHRRVLRSTREYIKTDGSVVLLDSSWEEALAIRLDFLNIDWIRPDSIEWIDDNGKSHNYFPDFYLTEYDIYLDPKNDQVYRITLDKIEKITKLLPNLKILRTLDECKNFII
jgi:hypothetical protein